MSLLSTPVSVDALFMAAATNLKGILALSVETMISIVLFLPEFLSILAFKNVRLDVVLVLTMSLLALFFRPAAGSKRL